MEHSRELARFDGWIRERKLANAKQVAHFVRWVGRFLDSRETRPPETWQDSLGAYLDALEDRNLPEWQLRQAADAVGLFCGQFHGLEQESKAEAEKRSEGEWDPAKALEEARRLLELRRYSVRTRRSYLGWVQRFFQYLGHDRGTKPTAEDVKAYLSYLALRKKVSASTQNQAFNALLFLFRNVLQDELEGIATALRARRGKKLPVVLSVDETRAVLEKVDGRRRLMLELIYGGGLRLSELVELRVKDIDCDAGTITVRCGKGDKDRVTILPERPREALRAHLDEIKAMHEKDLAAGVGEGVLPDALRRKYPSAGKEWAWQFVFPSSKLSRGEDGRIVRWHMSPSTVQKAMKDAVRRSGISKAASVHTLRHSFATHLLMQGVDIRRIRDLLGHKSLETTMIYLHIMQTMSGGIRSPLDEL